MSSMAITFDYCDEKEYAFAVLGKSQELRMEY
jgi:hypothetical protein